MEVERFEWKKSEKRRDFSKLKKPSIMVFVAIIVILLAIIFINNPMEISFGHDSGIENVFLELSMAPTMKADEGKYVMAVGEESSVDLAFSPDRTGEVLSSIELSPGVEYISGDPQMNGTVEANVTNTIKVYLRAVRVGEWKIKGLAISGNRKVEKEIDLCIDMTKEKAQERCE